MIRFNPTQRHTSYNRLTAYTLRANVLTLWDISPNGRDVVYAGQIMRNGDCEIKGMTR